MIVTIDVSAAIEVVMGRPKQKKIIDIPETVTNNNKNTCTKKKNVVK
jgi:hypothetical protein